MSVLALPTPTSGALRRVTDAVRDLFDAVAEGAAAAHRYERLARMSEAQLARRGLSREDVPWYAVTGERRPR